MQSFELILSVSPALSADLNQFGVWSGQWDPSQLSSLHVMCAFNCVLQRSPKTKLLHPYKRIKSCPSPKHEKRLWDIWDVFLFEPPWWIELQLLCLTDSSRPPPRVTGQIPAWASRMAILSNQCCGCPILYSSLIPCLYPYTSPSLHQDCPSIHHRAQSAAARSPLIKAELCLELEKHHKQLHWREICEHRRSKWVEFN